MTLTEFLLARFAEDEEAARDAAGWDSSGRQRATGEWRRDGINSVRDADGRTVIYGDGPSPDGAEVAHIVRFDPARVLAECEAKRRIVELCAEVMGDEDPRTSLDEAGWISLAWELMYELAGVYADHPDWREEWRA